ncbi:magnesium transporter [Microbacterium pseudoresistens]|uniref:Magnesium transporter MgtE n=1 Tax=Microbacterium pseudoresistens TaxID=640634 RepID=A0A7Y9EUI9_9MICO|nr:magnesium transporter [Microbacterium pseudoresistens]NYD54222.1 magnesium transporter [Microbacterium pseudoresistens]
MTPEIATPAPVDTLVDDVEQALGHRDLAAVSGLLADAPARHVVQLLDRLPPRQCAIAYRLLPKQRALEVFEELAPELQGDLVHGLQDAEIAALFAELDPDDRVWLLDELPASVAPRLLRGLPVHERDLTAAVLGYPRDAIGRRMSPEYVTTHPEFTAAQSIERVRSRIDDAETVYTLPVTDGSRRVVGVVSLRDLLRAAPDALVAEIMEDAHTVDADADTEPAVREVTELGVLAVPVVDSERRLVGILTIDDAVRILTREEREDSARQGGVEPLSRPYLSTPIRRLVRSRVVWLLVLALGATLTVQVLEGFESTLEKVTMLALFVPLLIGTGGNTGNQAATTVTRALAVGEVRARDVWRVLARELQVGLSLGLLLGLLGGAVATLVYDWHIGLIIALTLVALCTFAASVGGVKPLAARAIRVDPAVFSNPFISTFVDATGLIIYFLIARTVLGI